MTIRELWRRITTTRISLALEEEILPYMRAQQAEVTRQRAEISRQRGEVDRQRVEVARQGAEIDRLRAENRALLNSILGNAAGAPLARLAGAAFGHRRGTNVVQ